jgi:hypothetical protein
MCNLSVLSRNDIVELFFLIENTDIPCYDNRGSKSTIRMEDVSLENPIKFNTPTKIYLNEDVTIDNLYLFIIYPVLNIRCFGVIVVEDKDDIDQFIKNRFTKRILGSEYLYGMHNPKIFSMREVYDKYMTWKCIA